MKKLTDFNNIHIYFIGIGGISMSGLSKLAHKFGAIVEGSDTGSSQEIDRLVHIGIKVYHEHNANNIGNNLDLVVYSSAISNSNPELVRARELGIETLERSEFLGLISRMYNKVIAVSGTHGKTTTTALLGYILVSAGLNPTIHLGGESLNLGGNTIIGGEELLLLEACEYKESFRYISPDISVITNIEADHLDYFESIDQIVHAFDRFASYSKMVVMQKDCPVKHDNTVTIFGDWEIRNLEFIGGGYNFNVYYKGDFFDTYRLNMLGYHNVINSLFAIAVADYLGVEKYIISMAISDFVGVERRYESIYQFDSGCRIIIDYAHHYTEIKSSIEGLSEIYPRMLIVFQPHTYSRTLKLYQEFVDTLSAYPNVVLFKTYPAREEEIPGGTAFDLFRGISSINKDYFENEKDLIRYVGSLESSFDCVLILGAGDLAENLKRNYSKYINYC